ncbi:hypothetical protein HK104_004331 [Borealophlyctis nickersoniae]|nr:hypothetical protein HK104_004331 [Borealophlyctis nickersoniae]
MAIAIIGGLLAKGYPPTHISVSEPNESARTSISQKYGVPTFASNTDAVTSGPADVIVLAVKPQIIKDVATALVPTVQKHNPLVISIAAGIRASDLARWLGGDNIPVVRVMPNTPALVGEGATGMFAAGSVSADQKEVAMSVLGAVSKKAYWVEREELIDVVTGLSGPAYFFLMVECLASAATHLGLPPSVARGLASQTCLGAGKMLVDTDEDPAELRRKVTSPNGTTEAAVKSLLESGAREAFKKAVEAGAKRGEELGELFGKL